MMNRYDLRMILKEADETTSGAKPSTDASGADKKGKKPKKKMDPAKKKMAITVGAIGVCLLVTGLKNFSQTGDMFKGDGRSEILNNLFDSLGKQMANSPNETISALGQSLGFGKMNDKRSNYERDIPMIKSAAKEGGAYYNKDFVESCSKIGNGKALENLNTKNKLAELLGKYM